MNTIWVRRINCFIKYIFIEDYIISSIDYLYSVFKDFKLPSILQEKLNTKIVFQNTTEKMLKVCKEQCPYVLRDSTVVQEIKKECKNKKQIPLEFVTTCIKQQAGIDIMHRIWYIHSIRLCIFYYSDHLLQ